MLLLSCKVLPLTSCLLFLCGSRFVLSTNDRLHGLSASCLLWRHCGLHWLVREVCAIFPNTQPVKPQPHHHLISGLRWVKCWSIAEYSGWYSFESQLISGLLWTIEMIAPNIGWLSTFEASSWLVISLFFLGFTFWVKRRLCPVTDVLSDFLILLPNLWNQICEQVTFPNQTAIFLDLGSWMSMVCIFVNTFFRIKRASIPLFGLTKVTWFCMVRPKILSDYQSISFWDLITTSNGHISTIQYTIGIWLIPRIGGKLARNIPIISNHTINVAY